MGAWVPRAGIKGMNQVDLIVGYRSENWRLSVYAENLLDDTWYDANYPNSDPADPYVEHEFGPARPLTMGVRFGIDF